MWKDCRTSTDNGTEPSQIDLAVLAFVSLPWCSKYVGRHCLTKVFIMSGKLSISKTKHTDFVFYSG